MSSIAKTKSHLTIFSEKQETPTNFGNLPVQILGQIFRHFTEDELIKTVSPVCQRWRYAALQPDLWKNLKVVGDTLSTNKICDKIWMCPKLENVYLRQIPDVPQVLRQIGKLLTLLVRLTVRHCQLREEHLRYVIINCQKLQFLDIKGCHFKAVKLFEELSSLEDLKSVNLSDNSMLTKSNVYSAVVNCKNLEEFHLSVFSPQDTTNMLKDEDCIFILNTLTNLRKISLDAIFLTNITFQLLLDLPFLEHLGYYGALNLSPEIFRRLRFKINNLKSLKIRQTYEINPEDLQTIFEDGPYENLQEIDLTGSKIDDETLNVLSKNCPNLRVLILRSCKKFTDVNPVFNQCEKLELLNVAFCDKLGTDFVLPEKIQTLFLDGSQLNNFNLNSRVNIKICISEYNKLVENI